MVMPLLSITTFLTMTVSFLSDFFSSACGIGVGSVRIRPALLASLLFALLDRALEGQAGLLDLQTVIAQLDILHKQILACQTRG